MAKIRSHEQKKYTSYQIEEVATKDFFIPDDPPDCPRWLRSTGFQAVSESSDSETYFEDAVELLVAVPLTRTLVAFADNWDGKPYSNQWDDDSGRWLGWEPV